MRQRGRATARRGRLDRTAALAAQIRAAADRLFAADDARAERHGWQIGVGPGGLSRSYRDPRFDNLSAELPREVDRRRVR